MNKTLTKKIDEFEYEITEEGMIICPNCLKPMDKVLQTQYDNIAWRWDAKSKQYVKSCGGDSEKPMCGKCGTHISWEFGEILGY